MIARPILFSAPMVQALLAGRKKQTRRIVKPQPGNPNVQLHAVTLDGEEATRIAFNVNALSSIKCPYGQPGDLLWVRETWQLHSKATDVGKVVYRASEAASNTEFHELVPVCLIGNVKPKPFQEGWRSSIHMPRWASRLTLELKDVRVERLQEITPDDALAEGIFCPEVGYAQHGDKAPVLLYAKLWESLHGPGSWGVNPWVWALTFKVHQQNVDAMLAARAA